MDAFVMLQELLEQEQFELIFPERSISGQLDIRLVYLMNDAVESFLVFHNARMTGEYIIILIPPPVEPADEPTKIAINKII